MRIDGKALLRNQVLEVNKVIDKHWDSFSEDSVWTTDKEEFIQSSWGPDAIEMMVAGEEWVVCDRLEPNAVWWFDGRTQWVACRELFQVAAKFSPLERITWHFENNGS